MTGMSQGRRIHVQIAVYSVYPSTVLHCRKQSHQDGIVAAEKK